MIQFLPLALRPSCLSITALLDTHPPKTSCATWNLVTQYGEASEIRNDIRIPSSSYTLLGELQKWEMADVDLK